MNKAASALGKLSVAKRHAGMTKEQISDYYRQIRAKTKGKVAEVGLSTGIP